MEDQDLRQLETELAQATSVDPPRGLAGRVARRVAHELKQSRWHETAFYVAAVAAILLLWANLSLVVSRDQALDTGPSRVARTETARIEQLVPGISHQEAYRQALLMSGWQAPDGGRGRNAAALGISSF